MEKVYHVLYADETRLNSIDAQLHDKVPLSLQEDETKSITSTQYGEGSIPPLAKGGISSADTESAVQSVAYSFKDARFFEILHKLDLDILSADLASDIVPDGDIHVLSGTLKVSSMSAGEPIIEIYNTFMKSIDKTPALFGLKKADIAEAKAMSSMISAIKQIPAPPSFILETKKGERIFGPLLESSVRMPLLDQIMVFGNRMPFEWTIVGYVYPNVQNGETHEESFLFSMMDSVSTIRDIVVPKCDAIMIPLLILR